MQIAPPPDISLEDYAAIEEAVMETARGRWFLLEFTRRQRAAETQRLADIADRLETLLLGARPAQAEKAEAEPFALFLENSSYVQAPTSEPSDRLPHEAEAISEKLNEIAWSMRERGFDDALCAQIMEQARAVRKLSAAWEPQAQTQEEAGAASTALDLPTFQAERLVQAAPLAGGQRKLQAWPAQSLKAGSSIDTTGNRAFDEPTRAGGDQEAAVKAYQPQRADTMGQCAPPKSLRPNDRALTTIPSTALGAPIRHPQLAHGSSAIRGLARLDAMSPPEKLALFT